MLCVGSLCYDIGLSLKCKFYWQQKWSNTVSLCKKTHRNAISNQKNRRWVFRRYRLAWFCTLGYSLLASCGTLGRRSRNPWVPRNPGWKTLLHMLRSPKAGHSLQTQHNCFMFSIVYASFAVWRIFFSAERLQLFYATHLHPFQCCCLVPYDWLAW